jgi:hypothetical protein
VIEFIKKHKERVALLGVAMAFLLFIGGGIYLQKTNKLEKEPLPEASPIGVKLKAEQKETGQSVTESTAANTSYFLKPSPEELLEQLASMQNLNEDVIDAKFSQLPVLWPGYFFSLRQKEDGRMSLLLDVSEDGFGVVIESEVDPGRYPQLRELASGEKIWIGGKILAVDPTGTGTIYLKTEQLRFGGETPFLQNHQTTDK